MPYPAFDRSQLRIQPLAARLHDLTLSSVLPLDAPAAFTHPALPALARSLVRARAGGRARIFLMGAHVLRAGTQRSLIDRM